MQVEKIPFANLLSDIVDNRGRTCPTAEAGLPLIATNCIRNDLLYPAFEKVRHVSQETYDTWFRGHPKPGDLIFVCKGTPGRVCMAPDPVSFCIAQDMVAVRPNSKKIYPKYLFALLRSSRVQAQIETMHVGTLIPHFKKGDFDKLLLPIPTRELQETIGDMYFELSAKIELNRRMNATLEAIARALFQSWFVNFDLVRTKLDGSHPPRLDLATATLFPNEFEHSELGPIPKSWRRTNLGEVVEVFDSKRVPLSGREREQRRGLYPYYGAASVMDYIDDYLFDGVYMLMGEDGSVINEDGTPVTQYVWGKFWVNNHAHVLRGKGGICTEHLLLHLRNTNISAFVTGAVQPKLNQANMNRIEFIMPSSEIAKAFAATVGPLFAKIRSNTDQSRTLAGIRDTLLPKLLPGELAISRVH